MRDLWGFCQNSTVQVFSTHSLNIDLVTYSECTVDKPCNFPLKLVFIQPGELKGKSIWVWHWCDDFICHSLAGDVMKWVTERSESARSKEMALHLIERCAFVIHFLVRNPVLLFTDRWVPDAVRDINDLWSLFIECLPGRVKAFTTLLKRPQSLSEWTSLCSHSGAIPLTRSNY